MTTQTNARRKFNVDAKVVLRACSDVPMVSHKWTLASDASVLAADISPKNNNGGRPLELVTATMFAPLPPSSRPCEPYKFAVTAKFAGYEAGIVATATLTINHVSGAAWYR